MLPEIISKKILEYYRIILFIIVMVTIFFGYRAFLSDNRIVTDFSLEQLFPDKDPAKDLYEQLLQDFPKEESNLFIVYECENCLSQESLDELLNITDDLNFIEGVENVQSILSFIEDDHDDYEEDKWNEKISHIISNPALANTFIAKQGTIGNIIVKLENHINDHENRKVVLTQVYNILNDYSLKYYLAGIPFIRTEYVEFVMSERNIFIPIAFVVSALVLFYVFRQMRCVLLSLLAIGITLIWISGIMSMLNISINVISYLTFNLLTIIGVSDCIHILIKYHESLKEGLDQERSIIQVIKEIGYALFLTSFTTAVGFFSLCLTNIKIIREFGFLVGLGVILMFVVTIVLLPIILSLIKVPRKKHIERLVKGGRLQFAESINGWIFNYPNRILSITLIVVLLSIYGIIKVSNNSSVFDDFRPGNKIYESIKFVDTNLGGVFPIEILIETDREKGLLDPGLLRSIEQFQDSVEQIYTIGSAKSIVDVVKVINNEFNGIYEIPDSYDDISSYLSFEEESFRAFALPDFNKGRITCRAIAGKTDEAEYTKQRIHNYAKSILPNDCKISITGSIIVMLKSNKYMVKNLMTSFIVASIVIFFSMMFLFGSKRLALLSILPNIIPLMFAGGVMGVFNIILRPSTAMTFSIALGIAVDDTIHFLARFRQEYIKNKGDYNLAITKTLLTTGKAIISTTIVISLGFIVLLFSQYVPNFEFGLLGTIILIVALGGSLVLLPVLIILLKPKFGFLIKEK